MKECNLDCEFQEEGYCIADLCIEGFDPETCTAKSNDDLMSYEELERLGITDW